MLYGVPKNELEKNLNILKHLIHKCSKLGIKILEIPLVDSSSIKTVKDEDEFIFNIQKIIPLLESNDIFLTLETDFPPRKFEQFIGKFDHPNIKANYDIGNSTSLGYNLKEELEIMNQWIINIHIKDRLFKGPSVPLGKGNVDFETFFLTLSKINFKGDLIIQSARLDDYEKPEVTCKKYLKFVNQYVDKYL